MPRNSDDATPSPCGHVYQGLTRSLTLLTSLTEALSNTVNCTLLQVKSSSHNKNVVGVKISVRGTATPGCFRHTWNAIWYCEMSDTLFSNSLSRFVMRTFLNGRDAATIPATRYTDQFTDRVEALTWPSSGTRLTFGIVRNLLQLRYDGVRPSLVPSEDHV